MTACCDLNHDATTLIEALDACCDMSASIDLTEEEFCEIMMRIENLNSLVMAR